MATLPIVNSPLRDQVYGYLRSAILQGDLAAGERISPPDLAETLGVSTTPVRDALRTLEEEGLVETSPRRWTRVATPSGRLAAEIYPLIAVLEDLAIRLIPAVDEPLLERLREANAEFEKAAIGGNVLVCLNANDAFHETLLRASGNGALERTARDLKTRIRLLDSQYFREGSRKSAREHAEIIEALRQDDRATAAELIRGQWVHWLPAWGASPTGPRPKMTDDLLD